jgi:hypothetical protein
MRFFHWDITPDTASTIAAYAAAPALDRNCCNACATWLQAVTDHALPTPILDFMTAVGISPDKPFEVWGVPDGGFLAGWFLLVGTHDSPPWNGEGRDAVAEPTPGFRCWLNKGPHTSPGVAFAGKPLVEFEFEWESRDVIQPLERKAWAGRSGRDA